eukprot:jgi/Mesen1/1624/ME000135S00620
MEHRGAFITFLYHITVLFSCAASSAYGKGPNPRAWNFKYTGVIIPGFASSRLRAWAMLDCPYTPWEFNPLDPVWLDTRKVCLFFHFRHFRLHSSPTTRAVVFAHSMGNNVFRYFLEWLRREIPAESYQPWIDCHIIAYHAIAAPLLGAPETVKGMMTGITFGLPISEVPIHAHRAPRTMSTWVKGTARLMASTFGGALWMLPFSPHCGGAHALSCARTPGSQQCPNEPPCGEGEYRRNASGWPVPVVSVEMLPINPDVAYPGVPLEAEVAAATQPVSVPVDRKYTARQVADGTMLHEIGHLDPSMATLAKNLRDWYLNDEVVNPLTMWERPPIKHVYCQYGINLKTEVGYSYSPSKNPFPENWQLNDVYYETEGGILKSRSGAPVYGNTFAASGDATAAYEGCDVQREMNVEHARGRDVVPRNFTRGVNGGKYITYYEDSESEPGRTTAAHQSLAYRGRAGGRAGWRWWAAGARALVPPGGAAVDHRTIVKNKVLMREIWLQELHSDHPDASKPFVRKGGDNALLLPSSCSPSPAPSPSPRFGEALACAYRFAHEGPFAQQLTGGGGRLADADYREPMRDEDCYWDYGKARCALQHCCEYRYMFGDVHLGQSCRLKANNDTDYFSRYL